MVFCNYNLSKCHLYPICSIYSPVTWKYLQIELSFVEFIYFKPILKFYLIVLCKNFLFKCIFMCFILSFLSLKMRKNWIFRNICTHPTIVRLSYERYTLLSTKKLYYLYGNIFRNVNPKGGCCSIHTIVVRTCKQQDSGDLIHI